MDKLKLAIALIWVASPLTIVLVAFGAFQLIANDNPYGLAITLTATTAFVFTLWLYYKLTE
jgi:hypothetical protein